MPWSHMQMLDSKVARTLDCHYSPTHFVFRFS